MHEEDRERGKTNIGHFVLAIGAGPPVRQVRTAVAQRPDELFKVLHMVIDSEICRFGNPKKIAQIDKIRIAEELHTDWIILDTELMPWSAKAQELLRQQYGPTVVAAKASASALQMALAGVPPGMEGLEELQGNVAAASENATLFETALRGYCWDATTIEDYRIAPFHLLASEGRVYDDETHAWHMQILARIAAHDDILQQTTWRQLDVADEAARAELAHWWVTHTDAGGEGMVIKPLTYIAHGERGFIQPAMKVRGRNYLRIIYGPDYDRPHNIERLRKRGLRRKFTAAMREFALGLEGLHRFAEHAPLARVHECALAILALESEPIDPRL